MPNMGNRVTILIGIIKHLYKECNERRGFSMPCIFCLEDFNISPDKLMFAACILFIFSFLVNLRKIPLFIAVRIIRQTFPGKCRLKG